MDKKVLKKATNLQGRLFARCSSLKSVQDVAKLQARIIKKAVKDPDSMNDLYKLSMMGSMLVRTLEASSLEKRIETLEAIAEKRTNEIA